MQAYSGRAFTGKAYTRKGKAVSTESNGLTYPEEVIADTPVRYFRLQETAGTSAAEVFGNADGTYSGNFAYINDSPIGDRSIRFTPDTVGGRCDLNYATNFTSEFTVEFFMKAQASQPDSTPHLISKSQFFASTAADFPFSIRWDTGNTRLAVYLSTGNDFTADAIINSTTLTPGVWYHVVFVYRASALCELYINGSLNASTSIGFAISSTSFNWHVGTPVEYSSGIGNCTFNGQLCEVALYNYALVSSRVETHYNAAQTSGLDPYFANVVFVSNYENTNGATSFLDDSIYGRSQTFTGSAAVSTAQSRYGTSSLYIPGNDSYVDMADTADLRVSNKDFCIETFFYLTSIPTLENAAERKAVLMQKDNSVTGQREWQLRVGSSTGSAIDRIDFLYNFGSMAGINITQALSLNVWYYIAVRRKGNTLFIQLDNSLIYAAGFTGTIVSSTAVLRLGHTIDSLYKFPLKGYLDCSRITIGESRIVIPNSPPSYYPTT